MAKVVDALERSEVQVRYWEDQIIHSAARGRVEAGSRAAGDALRSVHPSLRPACVCALPPENLHPQSEQSNAGRIQSRANLRPMAEQSLDTRAASVALQLHCVLPFK